MHQKLGLYIHIPFCLRKCPYCAFSSVQISSGNLDLLGRYVSVLKKEMANYSPEFQNKTFVTIYFGGGTPSLLSGEMLADILKALKNSFVFGDNPEISLEANPGTVDFQKLFALRKAGFNRLSLGVQSFSNRTLRILNRVHSAEEAKESYFLARKAGFKNINLDLIYALPEQTVDDWRKDLRKAITLSPEHISTYSLTLEEETPFVRFKDSLPSKEEEVEMYEFTCATLLEAGYEHYEISNFAKPGFCCRHNENYWGRGEYLGLGAGAHSHDQGRRWANKSQPEEYIRDIEKKSSARDWEEVLTEREQKFEEIFLSLRQSDGIDLRKLRERFGLTWESQNRQTLAELVEAEMLCLSEGKLKPTERGFLLSEEIAGRLV
ncbi:MAG: radical SAM family heme chaperone HemW [Candidatus Edwardsbacteria bacterium]